MFSCKTSACGLHFVEKDNEDLANKLFFVDIQVVWVENHKKKKSFSGFDSSPKQYVLKILPPQATASSFLLNLIPVKTACICI